MSDTELGVRAKRRFTGEVFSVQENVVGVPLTNTEHPTTHTGKWINVTGNAIFRRFAYYPTDLGILGSI